MVTIYCVGRYGERMDELMHGLEAQGISWKGIHFYEDISQVKKYMERAKTKSEKKTCAKRESGKGINILLAETITDDLRAQAGSLGIPHVISSSAEVPEILENIRDIRARSVSHADLKKVSETARAVA